MGLISDNPYRLLGVFANDGVRVRMANIGKLRAFLRVGKTVHFAIDSEELLGVIARSEALIDNARTLLADERESVVAALFWFHRVNDFTSLQIKTLTYATAKERISSSEIDMNLYANVINSAVTFLAISDYVSAARQYAMFIESEEHIRAFLQAINYPFGDNESGAMRTLVRWLIEQLVEAYPKEEWWYLFSQRLTKVRVLHYVKSIFEQLAITSITSIIARAKEQKPVSAINWLEIAQALRKDCERYVKLLQPLEGCEASAEGQIAMDKLSQEIVRESKLYYRLAKSKDERSVLPTCNWWSMPCR